MHLVIYTLYAHALVIMTDISRKRKSSYTQTDEEERVPSYMKDYLQVPKR